MLWTVVVGFQRIIVEWHGTNARQSIMNSFMETVLWPGVNGNKQGSGKRAGVHPNTPPLSQRGSCTPPRTFLFVSPVPSCLVKTDAKPKDNPNVIQSVACEFFLMLGVELPTPRRCHHRSCSRTLPQQQGGNFPPFYFQFSINSFFCLQVDLFIRTSNNFRLSADRCFYRSLIFLFDNIFLQNIFRRKSF